MKVRLNAQPPRESVAAAMCEMITIFLAHRLAVADGRNPGTAVQDCAKRLIGRVPDYPAFEMLLKRMIAAPARDALKSAISSELNMIKKGLL